MILIKMDNKDYINIIKRQTNYSEEIIIEKLKKHNNNIEDIIREYNGIVKQDKNENQSTNQSTNQLIFKGIREFMN